MIKTYKYSHNYNVILDDMDMSEYRLKPISAIMYLQDAFARYCATKKVAAYDLFSKNLFWVVGEFNIQFENSLPFWSEEITVEIWISEISKLKIYTDYKLYYNDKIFAKGNACWFLLNTETKRPVLTDVVSDKFEIKNELAIGEHKKFIMLEPIEKVAGISHKNNISDLDFNNHVNNKSYIKIAEATAPDNYKNSHNLKNLYIKFCRESFLDDVLICSAYKTSVPDTFVHKILKDNVLICEIQTTWGKSISKENISDFGLKVR